MKTISIRELNSLITSTALLTGCPVSYGNRVYKLFTHENGVKWINYMLYEDYIKDSDKYYSSPSGWCALLRIA